MIIVTFDCNIQTDRLCEFCQILVISLFGYKHLAQFAVGPCDGKRLRLGSFYEINKVQNQLRLHTFETVLKQFCFYVGLFELH